MKSFFYKLLIIILFIFVGTVTLEASHGFLNYESSIFIENNIFNINRVQELLENYDRNNLMNLVKDKIPSIVAEKEEGLTFQGYYEDKFYTVITDNIFFGYVRGMETKLEVKEISFSEGMKRDIEFLFQEYQGGLIRAQLLPQNKYGISLTLQGKVLNGIDVIYLDYKDERESMQEASGYTYEYNKKLSGEDFSGKGYSFDYKLNWSFKPSLKFIMEAKNFYNEMKWNVYTIDSDRDNDHHAMGYKKQITHLTPRYSLGVETKFFDFGIGYREDIYTYLNLNLLNKPFKLRAGIYSDFYSFSLSSKIFQAKIMTKDLDLFNTTGIAAQIAFHFGY